MGPGSQSRSQYCAPELRLVLLGKTGAGKSASGNTILGSEEFASKSTSTSVTEHCSKATVKVGGRKLTVVDTPGFFDTKLSPESLRKELSCCISLCAPGPHAFLLVFPIGRYMQQEEETAMEIMKTFSQEAAKHMLVLFSRGDELKEPIEGFVEKNPELQRLVKSCGGGCHVFDNGKVVGKPKGREQVRALLEKVDRIVKENGGGCYTDAMYQAAEEEIKQEAQRIEKERQEEIRREEEKIQRLEEEMERRERAVQMQEERMEREEEEKRRTMEEERRRLERDREQLEKAEATIRREMEMKGEEEREEVIPTGNSQTIFLGPICQWKAEIQEKEVHLRRRAIETKEQEGQRDRERAEMRQAEAEKRASLEERKRYLEREKANCGKMAREKAERSNDFIRKMTAILAGALAGVGVGIMLGLRVGIMAVKMLKDIKLMDVRGTVIAFGASAVVGAIIGGVAGGVIGSEADGPNEAVKAVIDKVQEMKLDAFGIKLPGGMNNMLKM